MIVNSHVLGEMLRRGSSVTPGSNEWRPHLLGPPKAHQILAPVFLILHVGHQVLLINSLREPYPLRVPSDPALAQGHHIPTAGREQWESLGWPSHFWLFSVLAFSTSSLLLQSSLRLTSMQKEITNTEINILPPKIEPHHWVLTHFPALLLPLLYNHWALIPCSLQATITVLLPEESW